MAKKNKPETAADRVKQLQNNYVDLTKTGPLTYRELAYLMGDNRPYTPSNSIVAANQPRPILENLINSDKGVQYIQSDYGNSMFDPEGYATEGQLEQLNDIRAENQPWYAQIGAGLAKGVVLAGTTFLDGILGLILGGAEAIAKGDVSRLWDNDFSKAMQSINDWSEEAMPNYYSREELEEPWYKNIFTANWLGDKFLKNLGFSIGALYSGGVYTAGLKALKIPSLIGKVLKSTAAPKIVQSAVGATLSAVNEGRIEALNNSNDWQDLKMQELDDLWRKEINKKYAGTIQSLTDEYYRTLAEFENTGDLNKKAQAMALGARLQQVQEQASAEFENRNSDQRYGNIAGRIAEDRLKMGNMDLLMNIPILTASNVVQFTKYYARGFNTARKAGITGSMATGYAGREFSKLGAGVAIAKAGLSEGTEEISQKAASLVSGNYYSTDVNNYRKSQFDKNASQETLDWVKAFATGINETVNDASSWEEFTIGALTGFMGVPMFRGFKSADGKVQSPIYLEGGAREAYRNYKKDIERSQEIANYLNSRVQSPEFQNYYRGLVRHNKYQNDMNQAAMDDDEFNYKNAEYAQFVSDINMFDNAGRLEDLKDYISNMYDVSDEELEAIIDKTTSKDADGKSIGPFIDKNGNRLTSTEEGKQEMKDKLTKEKDSMLKTINNYRKTKDNLDVITGGTLTDDQLSELTWMNSQIDNWNERVGEMIPLVRRAITDLITNRRQDMSQIITELTKEGKDTSEMSKKNTTFLTRLETLSRMSDKQLKNVLTNPKNKSFVESLANQMDIFGSQTIGAIDTTSIKNILRDIPKIGEGIKLYNEKLAEYLKTPAKLAADQAATDEKAAEEFKNKAKQSFREKAVAAKNIAEFKQAYDEEQDEEVKTGVLKDLITEGNEIAKNYKDVSQYDSEINNALDSSGENPSIIEDAKALWLNHVKEAENLETVGNPNSVYINDDQSFLTDSEGDIDLASNRFQNARYALLQAMSKVNNDIKFRDRFKPEYKVPVDESLRGKDNITKETTGDSQTPTLPGGNTGAPKTGTNAPVGNISAEEVVAENADNNKRRTDSRVGAGQGQNQKKFYRPTIPELHIEASKEGDFRPFNVVVSEREPGKDFTEIYNYLRDNGAFDYVNSGKLKAGQTLLFMIDPEFEASVEGKPWHTAPTVFLTTEDGQIVGSLDEGSSIASFEGLENVVQKVRDEYQASRKSDTVGASPVALSYLLENGVGTIESTGYFLHAVAAAFPVISEGIESIRNSINTDILSMNPDGFVSSNHPAIKRIENLIRSTYGEEGVDIYNDLLKNSTGYIPAVGKKIEGRINNLTPKKETPATLQEVVDNLISTVEADNTGIDTDSVSSIKDKVNQIDTILKKERGAITQEDTASLESLFNELEDAVSKIKAINDDTLYTKVQKLVVDLFLRTNSRLGAELYEDKIDVYNIKGTLSRVEEGVAIYVDESGETNVILMGTDPHTMIGLFRESGSNRWSIKMENKNNPEMFKYLISSAMPHLPVGAEIYERTSISLDGLRVFAKQLEHGFRIGDETYETYINGADIKNAFGVSEKSQQNMNKVHISEDKFPEVKEKLRPYLEKFGITDIDSAVTLGERGTIKVKLPVIVKTDTTTQNAQEPQNTQNVQDAQDTTPSTSKFYATPKTKVSKIMVGKVPYSSEERSLADIPGVADNGRQPIFGIIRNGVLYTNNKVSDSLIIKPVDMSNKEGRLYLLIPNAAGTFSPVAVRVKHFNPTEFNIEDATVASTLIGTKINEVITKLAESANDEDVTLAFKELNKVIYSGDLHIDFFSSERGEGIRIVRVERDNEGNEVYTTDEKGNRIRKEDKRIIYFSNVKGVVNIDGMGYTYESAKDLGMDLSVFMTPKDINVIRKEITNALFSYNLPLQMSIYGINKPGYNIRAINSNILTSNLQEAKVIDSWFTTDYFDAEGNLQRAVNPPSVKPDPNSKPEQVVQGTKVTVQGTSYIVDLKRNIIIDEKTKARIDFNAISSKTIVDIAWAQDLYGDNTESSIMTDNKIITPEGRVLDRSTGKYLPNEEAQKIKGIIEGRNRELQARIALANKIVSKINENQKRVDKSRTDSTNYYIQEDDGQYHKYDRVHSRLGDNWLGKKTESENSRRALEAGTAIDKVIRDFFTSNTTPVRPDILSEEAFSTLISRLTEIKSNMEQMGETFLTNNIVLFHKYANGSRVAGEVDILSVDKNGNFKIYDVKTSRYSFSDRYFNEKSSMQRMSTKDYYTLQLSAYQNLFESQYGVRPTRLAILPFVLTHGTTQAAAVDIPSGTQTKLGLPIDSNQSYFRADRKVDDNEARFVSSEKDGKVYFKPILDTKAHEATLRSTDAAKLAVEFIGGDPKEASSFVLVEPGEATRNSENGRLMISKKAKVFAVTPSTPYSGTRNVVTSITHEQGIPITYNPAVNVPLESRASAPVTPSNLPIFDSTIETMNPENRVLPENAFEEEGEVGYYEIGDKVYKGYLRKVGDIEATTESGQKVTLPIYTTKIRDHGFGREGELGSTSQYLTVFSNGKAIAMLSGNLNNNNDGFKQAQDILMKGLSTNPAKVLALSSEQTQISAFQKPGNEGGSEPESTGGAAEANQITENINTQDDEFEDDLELRRIDENERPIWDEKKELSWLRKVLPQLSEQDRVKVVKGLIQVAKNGPVAWGMVSNGIMTLSDIAAEGTAYHEAFHVVFHYMLTPQERAALFEEASQIYGIKSQRDLEEDMAEGFREYVTSQERRGLGRRILDFFRNLFAKITNWKYFKPSLTAYYQAITQGKYKRSDLNITNTRNLRQEEYTSEMQSIKDKAIADGTFMKAPNGNPTNLNERQWLQVRTKAFKDWFGDWINNPEEASKVVDENGEPLVVYHRSNSSNISVFDISKSTKNPNTVAFAYHFGTEKAADEVDLDGSPISSKYAVFLNIRNNFEWTDEEQGDFNRALRRLKNRHIISPEEFESIRNYEYPRTPKERLAIMQTIFSRMNKDGYSYINYVEDRGSKSWAVFNPNQIKSATSNTGEFSSNNDDIRFRTVDDNSKVMKRESQRFLDNFGITIKEVEEFGGKEKLFDALNRVINVRNADDISEGVGEAIAFMMQHNDTMETLIKYKLQEVPKSIRRSIRKRGDFDALASTKHLDNEERQKYVKEIGKEIATELRKLYRVEPINVKPKTFLSKLWEIITEFFDKLTPSAKTKFNILRNYTKNIANSVKLNDPSIVLTTDYKPGTTEKAARVDIGKALRENPYERRIIEYLNSKNIALAGSASIALEGTLYRPSENPLHDIDFNAARYSKEELDNVIKEHFPHSTFVREITDGKDKITETYLVLDRPFATRKPTPGIAGIELYDKETGKKLGSYVGSELFLEKGVQGKFLDFFLGEGNNRYPYKVHNIDGKSYLVSDFRNAFSAKIEWARPKDIWDYNRFNTEERLNRVTERKEQERNRIKEKLESARIIWGHPAIGKTTYLERNQDILEWDQEVNDKRNEFFRDQIDPEHKLDPSSKEYKQLRSQYMSEWREHPEYVKFLTDEWEKLKERARRENKRLFASPAPLLEIGADDFDLYVNIPEKSFLERNIGRGGTPLGSMGWKQIVNDALVRVDPDKIVTTDKYFSEFMRDNLGVQWGTLTSEEARELEKNGWTKEQFERISQPERERAVKCAVL